MTNSPTPPLDDRGLPTNWHLRPEHEITPRDTRDALAAPPDRRPILLDCRRPDEHDFNRISGALHIPMNQIESRLDELEHETLGRQRPLIVYCHHGVRSLKVTLLLQAHGFVNARSMAGGIDLWSLDIDPSVPRY